MMIPKHFEEIVLKKFGFDFSPTQKEAVEHFVRFLFESEAESLFLLKGYAGTGKTSLVSAIVNTLLALEYRVVLLAPTGRAAKVFSSYAGHPAFTHPQENLPPRKTRPDGEGFFDLGFNAGANTLFFRGRGFDDFQYGHRGAFRKRLPAGRFGAVRV